MVLPCPDLHFNRVDLSGGVMVCRGCCERDCLHRGAGICLSDRWQFHCGYRVRARQFLSRRKRGAAAVHMCSGVLLSGGGGHISGGCCMPARLLLRGRHFRQSRMQQRSCGQLLPLRIQRCYGLDVPSGVLLFGWHERQDRMCRGHIWNGRLDVVCVQWQLHMRGRVCVRRGERVRGRRGMPRGQLLCWGLCAACRMYVRCRQLLPGWLNSCVGRQLRGRVLLRYWGLRASRRVHVPCGKLLWRGWFRAWWRVLQRGV